MKLIKNLLDSFSNTAGGFSARKLSAFIAVVTAIWITVYELPIEVQIDALYAWLLFALLCLGIITIENIINLKNGKKEEVAQPLH